MPRRILIINGHLENNPSRLCSAHNRLKLPCARQQTQRTQLEFDAHQDASRH